MQSDDINIRIAKNRSYLDDLLSSSYHKFDNQLRSSLPDKPGIYSIMNQDGEILRAGSTKTSDSLRQRVYQNHFVGNQKGNIRSQLVDNGVCKNLDEAKSYLKNGCRIQWKEILNSDDRK